MLRSLRAKIWKYSFNMKNPNYERTRATYRTLNYFWILKSSFPNPPFTSWTVVILIFIFNCAILGSRFLCYTRVERVVSEPRVLTVIEFRSLNQRPWFGNSSGPRYGCKISLKLYDSLVTRSLLTILNWWIQ